MTPGMAPAMVRAYERVNQSEPMASLVSRIKEKVHRRSNSTGSATAWDRKNPGEPGTTTPALPGSSPNLDDYRTKSRASLENSAFHVTSAGGLRKSLDAPKDPYQLGYANSNAKGQHRRIVSLGNRNSLQGQRPTEKEPGRHRVLPTGSVSHNNDISREEQQAIASDVVPERESSKNAVTGSPGRYGHEGNHGRGFVPSRKPLNSGVISERQQSDVTATTTTATTSSALKDNRDHDTRLSSERISEQSPEPASSSPRPDGRGISSQPSASMRLATIRPVRTDSLPPDPNFDQSANLSERGMNTREWETAQSKPLPQLPSTSEASDGNLAIDAQVAEDYLSTTREKYNAERAKTRVLNAGHLKLPPGFNLHDTETTHVTEEQRPAVVHEKIIKQKTEIVQEAITRDIHIHHYYTYLQPIRVVEILPAKHFFLDLQTGIKTEVLPPPDWQMPANMQPISPDTSMIKSTTRHYLVNEEHPSGILEPPPLKHEEGHENLREQVARQQTG